MKRDLVKMSNTSYDLLIIGGGIVRLVTNQLCDAENLEAKVESLLSVAVIQRTVPQLWDGHTAERVVESIKTYYHEATIGKIAKQHY